MTVDGMNKSTAALAAESPRDSAGERLHARGQTVDGHVSGLLTSRQSECHSAPEVVGAAAAPRGPVPPPTESECKEARVRMSKNTHGTAAGIASCDPGGARAPSARAHQGWAIPRPAEASVPAAGSHLQAGLTARTAGCAVPSRRPARRVRPGRGLAAIAAAFAALGLASATTAAVPAPAGDHAAIKYYLARANAYNAIPGAKIVETGYFFVKYEGGTQVDYAWGNGRPAGYVPAKGTIVARLSGGQIVAYLARLTAPRVHPVRVLMAGGEVYSSTTSCWRKTTTSSSPLGTGGAYVLNDGGARFKPLQKSGSKTTTTFSYKWIPGAPAVETSVFAAKDPAPFDVTIVVKGAEHLTVHKSVTPLAAAPDLPVPSPPGQPVPTPLCAT
jgi:hypothetical protein